MATLYAEGTSVTVDRSMAEIRKTLARFKAEEFIYAERGDLIMVGFVIRGIQVRIQVPLPDPNEERFRLTPTGLDRTETQTEKAPRTRRNACGARCRTTSRPPWTRWNRASPRWKRASWPIWSCPTA